MTVQCNVCVCVHQIEFNSVDTMTEIIACDVLISDGTEKSAQPRIFI